MPIPPGVTGSNARPDLGGRTERRAQALGCRRLLMGHRRRHGLVHRTRAHPPPAHQPRVRTTENVVNLADRGVAEGRHRCDRHPRVALVGAAGRGVHIAAVATAPAAALDRAPAADVLIEVSVEGSDQRPCGSQWVEAKGLEPSTPALQRWTITLTRASTSTNIRGARHSVPLGNTTTPRFASRAVSRGRWPGGDAGPWAILPTSSGRGGRIVEVAAHRWAASFLVPHRELLRRRGTSCAERVRCRSRPPCTTGLGRERRRTTNQAAPRMPWASSQRTMLAM